MARQTYTNWNPTDYATTALEAFRQTSVVNEIARHEPMPTPTKRVPRAGGWTTSHVAEGSAYPETTTTNDYITLTEQKFGAIRRIADESFVDNATKLEIGRSTERAAATSMAKYFDHATLGTTAAANDGTVPYNSLFYLLTQAESFSGYSANGNVKETDGALTVADVNFAVEKVETSEWIDDGRLVWLMHPGMKASLRSLVDGDDRPLWQNAANSGIANGDVDRLLGYPIVWTRGARTHATATENPTGDYLAFFGDPSMLIVGSGQLPGMAPGSMEIKWQKSDVGLGFGSDENLVKARMRRAFAVGYVPTWSVIRLDAS